MNNQITKTLFGTIEGVEIYQYTLVNANGMRVSVMNYGGTLLEIITKDNKGANGNVILRFDTLNDYLHKNNPYVGPLVGRYANRIGAAKFTLQEQEYILEANDHGNTLHGGFGGFDKVIWEITPVPEKNALQLNYLSKDGEGGFPGDLHVQVVYTLGNDNSLCIDYLATTNKATPVSLTSHAYFNLSAGIQNDILKHHVQINASKYIPVKENLIPTGELLDVKGSPMDFLQEQMVQDQILKTKSGYDHSWVLNKEPSKDSFAVRVFEPVSGRLLTMYTTEPAVQFYTGNFLDGTLGCNNGEYKFVKHAGLCLEAQKFPDSPNQSNFPNTILHPNQEYKQRTVYQFAVK